jgi:acetyl esterase/lipase
LSPAQLNRNNIEASNGFLLVLPGGGYGGRSDHEGPGMTEWLTEQGIAAGDLEYRVQPATYPGPLLDVLIALAELRAGVYGSVTGPVAVLGSSAGGHLAGLAATATEAEFALAAMESGRDIGEFARPDLVAYSYPVISLVEETHLGSRRELLGERWEDHAVAAEFSIDRRVDAATPPSFLWHTAEDAVVPVSNSFFLARSLGRAGVPFELHVFPYGRHGLGLGQDGDTLVRQWPGLLIGWLEANGIRPV